AALPEPVAPEVAGARATLAGVVHELDGDADVAAAVGEAGTVILGANFILRRGGDARPAAAEPVGLLRARHGEVVDGGGGGDRAPASAYRVDFTMAPIAEHAAG